MRSTRSTPRARSCRSTSSRASSPGGRRGAGGSERDAKIHRRCCPSRPTLMIFTTIHRMSSSIAVLRPADVVPSARRPGHGGAVLQSRARSGPRRRSSRRTYRRKAAFCTSHSRMYDRRGRRRRGGTATWRSSAPGRSVVGTMWTQYSKSERSAHSARLQVGHAGPVRPAGSTARGARSWRPPRASGRSGPSRGRGRSRNDAGRGAPRSWPITASWRARRRGRWRGSVIATEGTQGDRPARMPGACTSPSGNGRCATAATARRWPSRCASSWKPPRRWTHRGCYRSRGPTSTGACTTARRGWRSPSSSRGRGGTVAVPTTLNVARARPRCIPDRVHLDAASGGRRPARLMEAYVAMGCRADMDVRARTSSRTRPVLGEQDRLGGVERDRVRERGVGRPDRGATATSSTCAAR